LAIGYILYRVFDNTGLRYREPLAKTAITQAITLQQCRDTLRRSSVLNIGGLVIYTHTP